MSVVHRHEFENQIQGWVGVVKIDVMGKVKSVGVEPGGRVMLSEDERTLTAEAHAHPDDNPFVEREIIHYDPMTGEETRRFFASPLKLVKVARPTGAAQAPEGEPVLGTSSDEVGVPEATTA